MCGWQFAKHFAYLLSIRNWILILFLSSSSSDTDRWNSLLRAVFISLWHSFAIVRDNAGLVLWVLKCSGLPQSGKKNICDGVQFRAGTFLTVVLELWAPGLHSACWAYNTWSHRKCQKSKIWRNSKIAKESTSDPFKCHPLLFSYLPSELSSARADLLLLCSVALIQGQQERSVQFKLESTVVVRPYSFINFFPFYYSGFPRSISSLFLVSRLRILTNI